MFPRNAFAGLGPPGIYAYVDPYSQTQLSNLNAAAQQSQCLNAEPFCTSVNGILLNVDWCRFQGYPDSAAPTTTSGKPKDLSCHYYVTEGQNGAVQVLAPLEDTHQCTGTPSAPSYDTCAQSDLSIALNDIISLNILRATKGRPPLHLSLGLTAGNFTPEFVLLSEAGTSFTGPDAPLSVFFAAPNGRGCTLEPQVWLSSYAGGTSPLNAAYLSAYDELVTYVHDTMSNAGTNGSSITLVKVTPLNAITLEYNLPGDALNPTQPLLDPGSPDADDVPATCKLTSPPGATQWLNAYTTTGPISAESIIQAMEQTFGYTVGNLYAELGALEEKHYDISVATNTTSAYPQINCGTTGAGPSGPTSCAAQTIGKDQWSTYYLFQHISDLFTANSVAELAAQAGAAAISTKFPFPTTPGTVYVNTTNLTDPTTYGGMITCDNFKGTNDCPMVSEASLACGLNETGQSGQVEESFKLNGTETPFTGIGTQLGVQTDIGLDQATQTTPDYCTAPAGQTNLGDIFNYAIDNGTQFIEVTSDLVADSNCYSYMATALSVLLSPTRSSCLY